MVGLDWSQEPCPCPTSSSSSPSSPERELMGGPRNQVVRRPRWAAVPSRVHPLEGQLATLPSLSSVPLSHPAVAPAPLQTQLSTLQPPAPLKFQGRGEVFPQSWWAPDSQEGSAGRWRWVPGPGQLSPMLQLAEGLGSKTTRKTHITSLLPSVPLPSGALAYPLP